MNNKLITYQKFDWITISLKDLQILDFFNLTIDDFEKFYIGKNPKFDYVVNLFDLKGFRLSLNNINPAGDYVHSLSISGDSINFICDLLAISNFDFIIRISELGRVSRLDLAVDVEGKFVDFFYKKIINNCLISKFRKANKYIFGDEGCESIYLGATKGATGINIYNKKLQLGEVKGVDIEKELTRFELRLYNSNSDICNTFLRMFRIHSEKKQLFNNIFLDYFKIVDCKKYDSKKIKYSSKTNKIFEEIFSLENIKKFVDYEREFISIEKLRKQYLNNMSVQLFKASKIFGDDFIEELLSLGGKKVFNDKYHNKFIKVYKDELNEKIQNCEN